MRAWLALLVLLALTPGCRRRASFDRSSPETTLTAFFAALAAGQLPDHLDDLVSSEAEISSWRMRCQSRGCQGGRFTIVGHGELSAYQAILYVDYEVIGRDRDRVMGGTRSTIRFERESRGWLIVQFGDAASSPRPSADLTDAGPVR